ncbi:PTS fructose transporter subunit IIA [Streptomyces noursei]|nr:PTS fructose transporter subunit IIA [Streptomyces noursei]
MSGEDRVVGVVLVSHSKAVAEAVAELAVGLTGTARRCRWPRPAARRTGAGDERRADRVGGAEGGPRRGVALLVDLGSAVLTVKALIAEGDELPADARLVDAPFVEGTVAAVVSASAGADLAAVVAAAEEAYGYRKR